MLDAMYCVNSSKKKKKVIVDVIRYLSVNNANNVNICSANQMN